MSSNFKVALIVVGVLAVLILACVGGVFLLGYAVVDNKAIDESVRIGKEFGQKTDNLGCQKQVLSMLPDLKPTEIAKTLELQYYFDSCLEASTPTPQFCDGLPSEWKDIFDDDKGKDAECVKLGFQGSVTCRQIIKKKLEFCEKR